MKLGVIVTLLHVAAAFPHQLQLSGSDTVPVTSPARFRCQISMSVSILFCLVLVHDFVAVYWNLSKHGEAILSIHVSGCPLHVEETCKREYNKELVRHYLKEAYKQV